MGLVPRAQAIQMHCTAHARQSLVQNRLTQENEAAHATDATEVSFGAHFTQRKAEDKSFRKRQSPLDLWRTGGMTPLVEGYAKREFGSHMT